MTKKIKVLAIPTLLLVTGLASCNTLNSTSGGSGKTVSYEEAYKHVLKNHDPHLNDGLFATYTATINDLSVTNLGTYEKNTATGELDPISEISLGLSNVSVAVDSIPYTFAVGSDLFAKYGGYLNAPAAFSVLGVGAQVDYGYTINNGCLGYYLETNMLTPAINAVGGIMQLLLGKESETKYSVEFKTGFEGQTLQPELISGSAPLHQSGSDFSEIKAPTFVSPFIDENKETWMFYGYNDLPSKGEIKQNCTFEPIWAKAAVSSANAQNSKASSDSENGDESQGISTYLKLIQNISVGDTTVGLYLNFTEYGFVDSIRVKLNVSDLFAPLDVSVFKEIDGGEAMMALFGPIVGDAFEIGDLTLDVTLSAQYK